MQHGQLRYFSTFSGIGGFELGIERAIHNRPTRTLEEGEPSDTHSPDAQSEHSRQLTARCIGYSEIDPYAVKIYQSHFPDHHNYGDITAINEKELPDFDLFVGGFPCQAFSVAGLRRGFEDTRGTLFFEIARICRAKRPRLLLLENVKGLLSHDKGRTFTTIITALDELGYDLQWQVLNSKNHGVPQNRERVFIVGHLRGTPRPEVFPFTENGEEADELSGHVSNTLTRRYEGAQAVGTYIGEGELDAQDINQLNQPTHSNDRVYGADGISPTLNTMQGGNRQPFVSQQTNIRRLTPTECARLQGFPDDWHKVDGISDTQAYKCYGNAVTVNVIQNIIERLI
jgi:DNA (cytosine-5)-methyltransferase 1